MRQYDSSANQPHILCPVSHGQFSPSFTYHHHLWASKNNLCSLLFWEVASPGCILQGLRTILQFNHWFLLRNLHDRTRDTGCCEPHVKRSQVTTSIHCVALFHCYCWSTPSLWSARYTPWMPLFSIALCWSTISDTSGNEESTLSILLTQNCAAW